jgi:diaminopropionate ammonia-lyase
MWWQTGVPAPAPRRVPRALLDFHAQLPGYAPTPLVALPEVAAVLRVGRVLVKDESDRFGLPAFKMLGASWAAAHAIADRAGAPPGTLTPAALRRLLEATGVDVLLVTATAGNHGRAVARAARLLGASARIWTPASTPAHLRSAIAAEGAELVVVPGSYDDAVRLASDSAAGDDRAVLVQDTAQEDAGRESGGGRGSADRDIPARVVEGYATLFHEIRTQLGRHPDVVVVPTGVGSLALAAATYCGGSLLTVEPTSAACLLTSLSSGTPRTIPAGTTALAGLNAGSVSAAAWPVLRDRVAAAVAVTDDDALRGARELAQAGIPAGPCGGAALAGLTAALGAPAARAALGVDEESHVLVLSTDGESRDRPS